MPEETFLSVASATCEFELLKLPARHAGKCRVCRLRDRLAIELRFMEWGKPGQIARGHGIKNRASIYRHAHAANLFERRRRHAISAYQTTLKQFQFGQAAGDAVRIAEDRIQVAVRQHLAGPAFTIQDRVRSVFRETRPPKFVQAAAGLPSAGIQKPKSQHRQWDSRMSLILKNRKDLNPGKIAFHVRPNSAPLSLLSSPSPFFLLGPSAIMQSDSRDRKNLIPNG